MIRKGRRRTPGREGESSRGREGVRERALEGEREREERKAAAGAPSDVRIDNPDSIF